MSAISKLLEQLSNDMSELRKDVTAIQRTLVRMEATTFQPVCHTRRRSASHATQTWNNPQQLTHHSNRFAPYGSNHSGSLMHSSASRNGTVRNHIGNASTQNHCIGSSSSNMPITGTIRNAQTVVGPSKGSRHTNPAPPKLPAGPAEIRLTTMRQVLNKAATKPVNNICKLHRNFGNTVDPRQCPAWCTFHPKTETVQEIPTTPSHPSEILMTVDQNNELEQLPPPLQPDILESIDFDNVPSPANPLSLEMESELLDVSD